MLNLYKLKIALPYKLKDETSTSQEVSSNYIIFAMNNKNPQGLEGQARRIFGRLQAKLDEAIENKSECLELETSEFELIKKNIEEAKFPVQFSQNLLMLEEAIAEAIKNHYDKTIEEKK